MKVARCLVVPAIVFSLLSIPAVPEFSRASEETVVLTFSRGEEQPSQTTVYRVRRGDSLYAIVQREPFLREQNFSRLLAMIRDLNPDITNVNRIFPGQEILLPAPAPSERASRPLPDEMADASYGAVQKEDILYTVKPGDTISAILQRIAGIEPSRVHRYLADVTAANPGIVDINRIFPGQTIRLPFGDGTVSDPPAPSASPSPAGSEPSFTLSASAATLFVEEVVTLLGGDIIRQGLFNIPLPLDGWVVVDCGRVPVASFPGGRRILLDRDGTIPLAVAEAIETRWAAYRVLSPGTVSTPPALLQQVAASIDASFRWGTDLVTRGGTPVLSLSFDGVLDIPGNMAESSGSLLVVRLLEGPEEPLAETARRALEARGVRVVELKEKTGPVLGSPSSGPAFAPLSLRGLSHREAAREFLVALGCTVQSDVTVDVYTIEQDGFNLSVTADLAVRRGDHRLLATSRRLPSQFREILEGRGWAVIDLSETGGGEPLFGVLASATGFFSERGMVEFPIHPGGARNGGAMAFHALRIDRPGNPLYCVEGAFDETAYRFLNERWKVDVVVY